MKRNGLLTILALVSVIFLPWQVTVILALTAVYDEPLVPLAVGIFADTLYFTPASGVPPLLTILGAALSIGALFVRARLRTGPIRDL